MGIKETANTFHLSRNTVRKYVRLFISSGKTTEQLLELSEEHLREMFGCTEFRHREPSQRQLELDALIPGYVARLSRKGMTVRKLFNEYKSDHPDGFQESAFKRAVRQYRFHTTVVGHVEHYAADQMYVDFAGDKLEVVDEMTGEVKKAEVFLAILPFSHYTYCEAVWSQRKEDLIKDCQNAFEYFGGVTAAIVPDNLKAALKTSDRNEPVINDEFAAFAEHYGCAVYPARVRHPKDKALVENAVKLLYQSVYLDIEGMVFPSLVATHDRCDIPYTYSWKKEHNLPGHYGPYDKDLEELFRRAAEMDNIVLDYLCEVDVRIQYPPKSFSSCRGILSLEKKYGTDRLVAACACATMKTAYGYQAVKEILEQGDDADFLPDEDGTVSGSTAVAPAPAHKNIRGREYYSRNNETNNTHNNGNNR